MKCHLLPRLGDLPLVEVNKAALDKLLMWPLQETLSIDYVRLAFQLLALAFRQALALGLITSNPMAGIKFKDFSKAKVSIKPSRLRGVQLQDLLGELGRVMDSEPADAMLALMMLCHGTRIGETRQARWSHISLAEGEWFIPAEHTKTGVEHHLPLTEQVRTLLIQYRETQTARGYDGQYLFPARSGKPLSEGQASAVFMEDQQRDFYANGAKSPQILSTGDKTLTEAQRDQLDVNFKEISGGPVKKRLWILEAGFTTQAIGVTPQDAETMAARKFQVSEVARFFGVPPHLVGDVEKSTSWGSGIEQQNLGFLQYTLSPFINRWEYAIERWLLKPGDVGRFHAEHNLEGLLRGDSTARANYLKSQIDSGLLTVNEGRRLDNRPALPGGDVATRQSQNVPLDQLGKTNPAPSGV